MQEVSMIINMDIILTTNEWLFLCQNVVHILLPWYWLLILSLFLGQLKNKRGTVTKIPLTLPNNNQILKLFWQY